MCSREYSLRPRPSWTFALISLFAVVILVVVRWHRSIRRRAVLTGAVSLLLLAGLVQGDQGSEGPLKHLSLEELGNIEVTTASKEPVKVTRTPAAIYVITQE